MHHDPTSARELVSQMSIWQTVLWVVVFLLLAFVLALSLQNRDARQKIEELQDSMTCSRSKSRLAGGSVTI